MARRTCCRKWKRTLYQAATVCVIVFLLLQTPVDITFRSPTGAPLSDLESFDADGRLPADGRHFGNSTSGGAVSSRVTIDTTVPSAVAPTQQVASSPPATTTKVLEAPAGKTGPSVAEASGAKNCTIFTFWNFPRPPLYAHLNVETWRKHAHGLCDGPVLLNKTNVLKWIPDMPEEFFRLPYDAASSDMVRYGVLYHNGGLYFDSDFIVVKDLSDLIVRLPSYDLVSYETASAAQRCTAGGTFSSNFMGGRRGSEVLGEVYRTQVAALQKHCKTEKQYKSEMICCMDDKHVPCHIPWAQLGEGIGHPVVGRFVKKTRELLRQGKNPSEIKAPSIFCFKNEESFVPRDFVTILNDKPKVKQAMSIWEKAREKNAMERMAYHLFNANSGVQNMNRQQLFDTSTVLGTLYSRSEISQDAAVFQVRERRLLPFQR
eukprot:TRINITY_DN24920_c0_g1_i3.p1 TRINITY_DN24920_c0_g1~~TRINITY_DN24920_c0_g1_i3.p1  ORF type:complete len:431 (-),score=83.85 TRINITY_DN24920_c0_g1_i3:216-1508(-)